MDRPASSRIRVKTRKFFLVVAVAVVLAITFLASFRSTEVTIGVRKGGVEGSVQLKTTAPPEKPSDTGITVRQEAKELKGELTGLKATDVAPSDLSGPVDVTQKLGTVEGTVVGVDLSKSPNKKP